MRCDDDGVEQRHGESRLGLLNSAVDLEKIYSFWVCLVRHEIFKLYPKFSKISELSEKLKPTQNPALSIVIIEFEGERTKRNVADGEKGEGLPM